MGLTIDTDLKVGLVRPAFFDLEPKFGLGIESGRDLLATQSGGHLLIWIREQIRAQQLWVRFDDVNLLQ